MTSWAGPAPYREAVRPSLPRLADVGLAVALVAAGLAEVWVPLESRQGDGSQVAGSAAVVLSGLLLTQRRTHPLPACLGVLLIWPLTMLVAPVHVLFFGQFVPMAVAVFSLARHGRGREPWYAAGAAAAALLWVDLFVPELRSPGEIVFHWSVFAIVWGFGYGLRRMEQRAQESTRRAVEAEVAAAEQALAAVVAERTRIARELHDIVAHSVSMMVVQAGAAEQVVDDDPTFVRRALGTIRTTGTDALAEMRRVVVMLREGDEPGTLAPQPGLDGLTLLLRDAEATGLATSLEVTGAARELPAGLDLTAYRIVQEAVTNVRRHARATRVAVRVAYDEDELRLEVVDDGAGPGEERAVNGTGHGLVGMRERAALYGGTVEAGADPGRGFAVRAVLPVGGAS
jgi:signal transduction histidine kinase